LSRIKGDKTRVVTPIIDIINADTFQYSPSPLVRGGFNWGLNFKWDPIPRSELQSDADFAKPFKSPTMAGGNIFLSRGSLSFQRIFEKPSSDIFSLLTVSDNELWSPIFFFLNKVVIWKI
jgi:polypeptide N-acetylgalactosaminyltransferase